MLNTLICFEFTCADCGTQKVWSKTPLTACPADASHEIDGVSPVAMATSQLHLHDDAGRIYHVSIDGGTLVTKQVDGPA